MSLHAYDVAAVYNIFKQEQGSNNFAPPICRSIFNVSWFEQESHFKDRGVNSIYFQPVCSQLDVK